MKKTSKTSSTVKKVSGMKEPETVVCKYCGGEVYMFLETKGKEKATAWYQCKECGRKHSRDYFIGR